jgi:isoleucyl-tRNA synthetase
MEELNVKAVEPVPLDAALVSYRVKPNLPRIGKRYGKQVPTIRAALAQADGAAIAAAVAAGENFEVEAGGERLHFEPEDVLVETQSAAGYACAEEAGYMVGLDTRLDEALAREGLAREVVRTVQEARKQAGLEVSDRIGLRITGSATIEQVLAEYREHIMDETLATQWGDAGFTAAYSVGHELDAHRWHIALARIAR